MKILIVGSGAREHALAWKIAQSPLTPELYCAPGNAGTRLVATNIPIKETNLGALAVWAVENKVDLTIVGPEAPLAEGIVDLFQEHGLKIVGPVRAAARMEASKSFAKEVMLKAGVNTAKGAVFENFEEAKAYVEEQGAPIVVKADGLASGKGVVVAQTVAEAIDALHEFMVDGTHGASGTKVVVEQCLFGEEASAIALVDGVTVLPLVVSQDYKRVGDGNTGPNTGGMGSISPTPVLSDLRVEKLVDEIFVPTLRELASRGIKYTGFLYAGILVEKSGATKVLEFNCRSGDPETQVLMMRLRSDIVPVFEALVNQTLASIELQWKREAATCVVMASRGYPKEVDDGKTINGLANVTDPIQVFHAGTLPDIEDESQVLTKGGRILSVAALGESVEDAAAMVYDHIGKISFDGVQYRKDIGS